MNGEIATSSGRPTRFTSGRATRPGWRRTFWRSSTSTKTHPATARSSAPCRSRARQRRKRAAPLPSVRRQEHPGVRRAARAAARAEQHLLLRCLEAAPSEVPVLDERHALEHHRRLPAAEKRRLPRHPDGRPRRRHARPRRRVRRRAADGGRMAGRIRRSTISTRTASRRVRIST